jgi:hypothetical protein
VVSLFDWNITSGKQIELGIDECGGSAILDYLHVMRDVERTWSALGPGDISQNVVGLRH